MRGTVNTSPELKKLLNVTPVILAGGMGARLRPLTGPAKPKPFLRLFSKNTLLQETLERVRDFNAPVVVTAAPHAAGVFEQCYEVGVKPAAVICEPAQRGTALAIACAAMFLRDMDSKMLVMPSDHVLDDEGAVYEAVSEALGCLHDFVLLGVSPRALSDRFGYIVTDLNLDVRRFIEKPRRSIIPALAKEGKVFWNTGMFVCAPSVFLNKLKKVRPDIYEAAQSAMTDARLEAPFVFPDADPYLGARSVAVDVAVMEYISHAAVVPLAARWSDVGTLGAFFSEMASRFFCFCDNLLR